MLSINRSLVYSALAATALALASCSSIESTAQSADTPESAAAQRRLNVYFDVGKSGLTPEAQQVIAQAVAETHGEASLKLSASADRSHSKLSERRAAAVRAALVAGGIAPDRIAEVRTADGPPTPGIRDPRDRAVEISIQ